MAEQISYLKEMMHHNSAMDEKEFKKLVGHLDVMNAFVIDYTKNDTVNDHRLQQLAGDVRNLVCRAEVATEKLQQRSDLLPKARCWLYLSYLRPIVKEMNDMSAKVAFLLRKRARLRLEALEDEEALVREEDNGVNFEDDAETLIEAFNDESNELDTEEPEHLGVSITEILQKIKPCGPVFKAFYFRILKEIKLNRLNSLLAGQIIQIFLDRLLENLVDILKEDFRILEQSLMFLISFLANAEDEEQAMVTAEIEVLVKEDMFLVLSADDSKSNACLSDFMRKVRLLKGKEDCIIHRLRLLSEKESWELLRRKAFHAEACPSDFSTVGKMIAENCNGLPLTVVLIGGLLARTERTLSWWYKVSETISSYVTSEGGTDVLEFSYQHLPEHLKSCFLYFCAFAEDAIIHVNKLTLLWIAEGFVQNSNKETLKNMAKEYLRDLVDRSLVIANEGSSSGGIKSCRIHDLVREFCQRKAQEENFFQLIGAYEASNSSSSTVHNPYRVSIHINGKYFSGATETCPSIHSLIDRRSREIIGHDRISELKLVQVMDLENSQWDECFVTEIASLVHLRFIATSLTLKSHTLVPSSMSNLWNLEILILKGVTRDLKLPETLWNMTRLRHVDVGDCYISNSGVEKREAYSQPQMVNLESFSSPKIFTTEDLEDLLQRSPFLRKLGFENYVDRESFHFPKLDSVSKLESLKVSFVGETCIRSLNFLSTLKKLSLSHCYIDWRYMPMISKMPCLEVLKLLHNAFVGLTWDMEDTEFPKLKFLKLQRLRLAEWIEYDEPFPSLEVLIVSACYNLKTIPPCLGELSTLKRIEVHESDKVAASVFEIQEAQKEFGNQELQVIVTKRR